MSSAVDALKQLAKRNSDGSLCWCDRPEKACHNFKQHPLSSGGICECYHTKSEHNHSPACLAAWRVIKEEE